MYTFQYHVFKYRKEISAVLQRLKKHDFGDFQRNYRVKRAIAEIDNEYKTFKNKFEEIKKSARYSFDITGKKKPTLGNEEDLITRIGRLFDTEVNLKYGPIDEEDLADARLPGNLFFLCNFFVKAGQVDESE